MMRSGGLRRVQGLLATRDVFLHRNPLLHLERRLRTILTALRTDLVIDIGGNIGQNGLMLRERAGYGGRIVSFEPSPESFVKLEALASRNEPWQCFNLAIGSAAGALTLQRFSEGESMFDSFLPLSSYGTERFPALTNPQPALVEVKTLDDFVTEHRSVFNGLTSWHLKTDTQGFDLEVLRGAHRSLETVGSIQIEIPVRTIYDGAPSFVEMVEFLSSAGFEPAGFFPIACDNDGLRIVEFDGLFLRRES